MYAGRRESQLFCKKDLCEYCKYDVNFKISKLTSGNYNLKVYYARPNVKYDESNIAYNGQVNIAQNKKVSVTFNPEVGLPEN